MSSSKNIILGVSGSISAYKSANLCRLLVKKGCDVQVVLTPGGATFITPLTLATVSQKPVLSDFFEEKTGSWNNHVHLGEWADLLLVAPASANEIAAMSQGKCEHLLHAIYLSAKCAVLFCPAMDHDMWNHPAVQRNCAQLQEDGAQIMSPERGELASGIIGDGRLPQEEKIVERVSQILSSH